MVEPYPVLQEEGVDQRNQKHQDNQVEPRDLDQVIHAFGYSPETERG